MFVTIQRLFQCRSCYSFLEKLKKKVLNGKKIGFNNMRNHLAYRLPRLF